MSRETTGSWEGKGHVRTPSLKSSSKSSDPTVVSLFVTNLRLLNLDLQLDWPDISVSSFCNNDARTRIRCTEFALFHLFRLYDRTMTAEKLQPFYPPLEPLQSINLRAALYRCLNELKKSGGLSKETLLRKTMLDDCQGDKFWEFCLGFSATTLRKVTLERKSRYGKPIAERIGVAPSISKEQKASMLPLAIAHKAALAGILKEKQRKKQTYTMLYDVLVEKEGELARRKAQAQDKARTRPSPAQLKKLEDVERNLERRWMGNKQLRDVLVNGDDDLGDDMILAQPLERLAKSPDDCRKAQGLLHSMVENANIQTRRVRRWQSLHQDLLASKPKSRQSTRTEGDQGPLRFDKHHNMNVRDASPEVTQQRARPLSEVSSGVAKYDEILIAMREELRRNKRAVTATQPGLPANRSSQPPRKSSMHLDTSSVAPAPHQRSPSQTAVPMRSGMQRRVPSRSRSYQQPKVESQRQPIPLKAELFSPLKSGRRSSTSPLTPSPVGTSLLVASPAVSSPVEENDVRRSPSRDGKMDSGIGLGISAEMVNSVGEEDKKQSEEGDADTVSTPVHELKVPALIDGKPDNLGRTARPSLADRTRMSMAFRSADDITATLSERPNTIPPATFKQDQYDGEEGIQDLPNLADSHVSLVERTRKSISWNQNAAVAPLSRKKSSSHKRSRTSVYPVNQFDTPPRKARSSTLWHDQDQSGKERKITPREELFSPEADYDSVFKPRPKVAISPKLSPFVPAVDSRRSSMDETLNDEDVARSSPLGRD